jgi:hypothetical protein
MSFNSILQLLDNGISKDQVLAYLKNASPKIAKKVQQMLLGGYGAGEILKHLSKDPQTNHAKINKPYSSDDIANLAMIQNRMNVPQTRDEEALQQLKKATPYVISALGAIAPFAIGSNALGAMAPQLTPTPTPSPSPAQPNLSPSVFPQKQSNHPLQPTPTSPINQNPTPQQPLQPGPGLGQQVQQQAQSPVTGAMQPTPQPLHTDSARTKQMQQQAPSIEKAKDLFELWKNAKEKDPKFPHSLSKILQTNLDIDEEIANNLSKAFEEQAQPPVSIFQQLTSGIDIENLDPKKQQQIKFMQMISDQLESTGKTINDPAIKGIAKKIKAVIEGKPDVLTEEATRFQGVTPEAAQSKAALHQEIPEAAPSKAALHEGIPEEPKTRLKYDVNKKGELVERIEKATYGRETPEKAPKTLKKPVRLENKYEDLTPEQKETYNTIDNAVKKTAEHLVSGKDFMDLLPSRKGEMYSEKNKKGIVLSTAEDVLRHIAGVDSKYNLLTPEEQEEAFDTFTGLTPNLVWNTISLIDPKIQKITRPMSPKGSKAGKEEMTPNDFRRFLGHGVFKAISILGEHDGRANMIISAVDMIDSFRKRKQGFMNQAAKNIQEMDDNTLQALFAAFDEEKVKGYR